jgi:hypothetical protein
MDVIVDALVELTSQVILNIDASTKRVQCRLLG